METLDDPCIFYLSEHLKGFSAVNLPAENTTTLLQHELQAYGPVERHRFTTFAQALDFLLPIKSFTTRFLVLGMQTWSILVDDMREDNCNTHAYAISRATRCKGIAVCFQATRREFHIFEDGKCVREVQSLLDTDEWYYREQGSLQAFEDLTEYTSKKKRYRLKVDAVIRYYRKYTGLDIPNWKTPPNFTQHFGLERSNNDRRVPLHRFRTIRDV